MNPREQTLSHYHTYLLSIMIILHQITRSCHKLRIIKIEKNKFIHRRLSRPQLSSNNVSYLSRTCINQIFISLSSSWESGIAETQNRTLHGM